MRGEDRFGFPFHLFLRFLFRALRGQQRRAAHSLSGGLLSRFVFSLKPPQPGRPITDSDTRREQFPNRLILLTFSALGILLGVARCFSIPEPDTPASLFPSLKQDDVFLSDIPDCLPSYFSQLTFCEWMRPNPPPRPFRTCKRIFW